MRTWQGGGGLDGEVAKGGWNGALGRYMAAAGGEMEEKRIRFWVKRRLYGDKLGYGFGDWGMGIGFI